MMGENRNGLTGVGVNQRGQMLGLFAPKLTPILSFTERVQGDQPDRIIFDRIVDEVAVGGWPPLEKAARRLALSSLLPGST